METGRVGMFPLCGALKPLTLFSILKGIIWLLIATAAGIPPTASSASFPVYLLSHRHMNDPGIHFFESKRYCYSLFLFIDEGHRTERDSPYQFRSTSYVLMYHIVGEVLMFGTFCNTDVSAPLGDHKYNRCDTDLSLSGRLYLRVLKHVLLHPSIPFFSRAHYCRWLFLQLIGRWLLKK
jgi:hypothetical protein